MEKLIRYVFILFLILAAAISSFSIPRREIKRIAQVAGIALDKDGEEITATFELFEPSVDQPYGNERGVVSAKGETLKECVENARLSIGKELYLDDALVLIMAKEDEKALSGEIKRYYKEISCDYMDLPLAQTKNQKAGDIFKGKGKILSIEIAESIRLLGKESTVKDLFNGEKTDVFLSGVGAYEIVS